MYDELSEADIQKMKEEIEYRKVVVRKEALAAVKEAREQGDLSENFEYQAAKREKNRNESRIRYLERMVGTSKTNAKRTKPSPRLPKLLPGVTMRPVFSINSITNSLELAKPSGI